MRAPIRPFQRTDGRGLVRGRVPASARPGVSFLEVVLGVALLGMVAGTLSVTVSAIGGSFMRQQDRLGAAEIASRLLLMRADDEDSLPGPNEDIPYGERSFRWMIEERPVLITLSEPAREATSNGTAGGGTIDLSRRIVSVTVTTWLSEFSGGSAVFDEDLPHYSLTRLIDPISFTTSDSAEIRLETQEDIENFMGNVIGSMSAGDLPTGAGGSGRGRPERGAQPQRGNRPQPSGEPQRGRPQPQPQRQGDGGSGGGG